MKCFLNLAKTKPSCADNETFLASTNCRVVVLLQYMRSKLGLPESGGSLDSRGVMGIGNYWNVQDYFVP